MSVQEKPGEPVKAEKTSPPKLSFEDKLDQDFMVILSTIKKNINNLSSEEDQELAQQWLGKLCGEAFDGVEQKRSRNIYLTRIACQLPEPNSHLNCPFNEPPEEGKLPPAEITFKLQPPEEKAPGWIKELINSEQASADIAHTSKDGRTYLATHTMKNGVGAFGYLAVTMAGDEPLWVDAGEDMFAKKRTKPIVCRDPSSPQALISRLNEEQQAWSNIENRLKEVSNKRVIENIQCLLEKRRTPEERDGLLHFYDILLENIQSEMDNCGCGKVPHNSHVQHLLEKLERDLEEDGENICDCEVSPMEKRMTMLELLYKRTEEQKKTVQKREESLDRMERSLQGGMENTGEESEEDVSGDSLWINAVEQGPSEQNMKRLLTVYPPELVERFVELLAIWRQDMIRRSRNRHESVVAAMKKELKLDVKEGLEKYKEARDSWMKVAQALQEVQTAQKQAKEDAEVENLKDKKACVRQAKGRQKLLNQLYDEFTEADQRFQNEKKAGQKLKESINLENHRIENALQISEAAIEQLQSDGDALRQEIVHLEYELDDQELKITELENLLDGIC